MRTLFPEVLAVHGWGYSGDAWRRWADFLPGEADFRSFDRGYFGPSREVAWRDAPSGVQSATKPLRILLLHSMAPLFVPSEVVAGADLVLLFGGFQWFHPESPDDSAAPASREVLSRMREALAEDPWKVIESFRRRCALPGRGGAIAEMHGGGPRWEGAASEPSSAIAGSEGRIDADLLAADLDSLDSEEIDFDALRMVSRILVFHGTGDRIVPHTKGERLAHILGDAATFFPIDGAGHALPFTHTNEIWKMIDRVVGSPGLTGRR